MVTNLSESNSIISEWISEIRDIDIQADRMRFRSNLERFGLIAGYEISKYLKYNTRNVQTPLGEAACAVLENQPVIATILRAGLPLFNGLLQCFDKADTAFIGAYRKHNHAGGFEISQQYMTSHELEGKVLIMADPMLATGASLKLAIENLVEFDQPAEIHIVTVIACTEGIEILLRHFPEIHLWAGAIDDELTAKSYIVPGLGDAGDLSFGKKRQF